MYGILVGPTAETMPLSTIRTSLRELSVHIFILEVHADEDAFAD